MPWSTTDDPDAFLAAAGDFLTAQPARNTILLTVAESLRASGRGPYGDEAPLLGWWRTGERVAAACLHTPPHPLLVSDATPDAAAELAAELTRLGRALTGVNATAEVAGAFAAAWLDDPGADPAVRLRTRLYRLATLDEQRPRPPGGPRAATTDDRDLLVTWYAAFVRETGTAGSSPSAFVDERLAYGGLVLWHEPGGAPVALAGRTRLVAGMIRIAPVYTPDGQRRHGYGGAVTAAISADALQAGAREVLIFADLGNAVTQALYERLGYRRVEDHVVLDLGGVAADEPGPGHGRAPSG